MPTNIAIDLLERLVELLQSCFSVEEVDVVLKPLMQQLFPKEVGAIYLMSSSKKLVESIATWGSLPLTSDPIFTPHECVALRRGHAHGVEDTHYGLRCQHIRPHSAVVETLCVPMTAHGEIVGVLYIGSLYRGRITQIKPSAVTVAKYISLALANLKLRDTLNYLRLKDPLTTLYNRGYLEEYLEREIERSERQKLPLGLILLRVDCLNFINDRFGYGAGDFLLRELGRFLPNQIRAFDIACRYRSEEFLLLLPEATLTTTQQLAERLRRNIKQLKLKYGDQVLDSITVSCGVANFCEHGLTAKAILKAANASLHQALA
jgi:diguanylate cyclase (GGDEF)-like protein